MRQILVSGGAGFLGSHLVDRLLKRQDFDRIVVVDNLWTGSESNLRHVEDERLQLVISDFENFSSEERFDEVFHLASPASPPWYMAEPVRTISANVVGTMNALRLLKDGGRLCFTSTSEVYGDPLVTPQPESYRGSVDCTGPRSSYDESKRCAESLLFETRRVNEIEVRVARLFNVYGPRTKPDDGRAVSNFITSALRGEPITVYGDGQQTRSWGFVSDIMDGLERLFWLDDVKHSGPINIGNDREISVLAIAEYVAALVPGTQVRHVDAVPQDPSNRRPDLTNAKAVIPGWNCNVAYEEGLVVTLDWFRSRLETPV